MAIPNYFEALTLARRSVWQAIDNYADTRDLFNLKLRFDGTQSTIEDLIPGFADLDAILIRPAATNPKWLVTTVKNLWCSLIIVTWTRDWNLDLSESVTMKVIDAIHKAKPTGGVPYVRAPQIGPTINTDLAKLNPDNPIKCIKTTMQLVLPVQYQP